MLYASVNEYNMAGCRGCRQRLPTGPCLPLPPFSSSRSGSFGFIVGSDAEAQQEIYAAIETIAGTDVAEAFQTFVGTALAGSGSATIVGLVLLFWTTSSLFYEVQKRSKRHIPRSLRANRRCSRVLQETWLGISLGFWNRVLVLMVWIANIVWQYLEGFFEQRNLDVLHTAVNALTPLVSMVFLPILFALLYQSLTDVRIIRRALSLARCLSVLVLWSQPGALVSTSHSRATPPRLRSPHRYSFSSSWLTFFLACFSSEQLSSRCTMTS